MTAGLRTTRYADVCGGTDEFKRLLLEEPAAAGTPEGRATLEALLDDGMSMLARMDVRLREYQAFRDELIRLTAAMQAIEEPALDEAGATAAAIRDSLQEGASTPSGEATARRLIDQAEAIRQVANDMEGALRRHKEGAIEAARAYLRLRGGRGWGDGLVAAGDPAAGAAPLPAEVPEAWLPPSPHRELIVDWLRRGRAALLPESEAPLPAGPQGREPLVQFEDGGVMPLRVVRWSEEVQNFYPLGAPPHPRGRLYRSRDAVSVAPGGPDGGPDGAPDGPP